MNDDIDRSTGEAHALVVPVRDAAAAEEVAHELFRTAAGRADPYPLYHRLRDLAPVHRSDNAHGWLLTRYEDCAAALRDPRLGKDYVRSMDERRPDWRDRPSLQRGELSMLNTDGPYHTRLRKLVSRTFTPRSIEALRPRVEAIVDDYMETFAASGRADLMADVAFPLPVQVIGELLGIPEEDRPQFRDLVRDFTAILELGAGPAQLDAADAAWITIDAYFRGLLDAKRTTPDESLLGRLVAAPADEDHLSDDELISLASLLFAAGFETTTNLIGNGMLALLRGPGQLALLRDHPELLGELPDELLRYDGTVQLTSRFAKEDIVFDDVTIPAGEIVFPLVGAGNRDPARYADPDTLDVTRTNVKPLTFGGGVHFCLGAALARLEIETFFARLLERFGTIELDGDPPPFRDRLTLRGLPELWLRFEASGRRTPGALRIVLDHTPDPIPPPRQYDDEGILPPRPAGPDDRAWRAAFRARLEDNEDDLGSTIELLSRVPLFAACTPDDLRALAAGAYPIAFERGAELCLEGADAPECYVIAEGQAVCSIGGERVATVEVDDVVGELGPLEGRPRAATVTATTHMVTYAISRDELQALIERNPQAAEAMRRAVRRRYGSRV